MNGSFSSVWLSLFYLCRQAKEVIKAIKKRLGSKNANTQLYAVLVRKDISISYINSILSFNIKACASFHVLCTKFTLLGKSMQMNIRPFILHPSNFIGCPRRDTC